MVVEEEECPNSLYAGVREILQDYWPLGRKGKAMKIIAAVDDRFGMFFNHRRLSRDRAVTEKIKEIAGNGKLWIHPYSLDLFPDACVAEDFLDRAGKEDFCFVENRSLRTYSDQITEIYLFFWNRNYPSDLKFDLSLEPFWCEKYTDFPGYSHDDITLEIFGRKDKEKT